jgi:hypothetical protein
MIGHAEGKVGCKASWVHGVCKSCFDEHSLKNEANMLSQCFVCKEKIIPTCITLDSKNILQSFDSSCVRNVQIAIAARKIKESLSVCLPPMGMLAALFSKPASAISALVLEVALLRGVASEPSILLGTLLSVASELMAAEGSLATLIGPCGVALSIEGLRRVLATKSFSEEDKERIYSLVKFMGESGAIFSAALRSLVEEIQANAGIPNLLSSSV